MGRHSAIPNQKLVSEKSGVSASTVSRYFSSGSVSAENRDKIEAVIAELGSPSVRRSRSVSKRQTSARPALGVIVPRFSYPTYHDLIDNLRKRATGVGFDVRIEESLGTEVGERLLIEKMIPDVAGFIMISPRSSDEKVLHWCSKQPAIPFVLINRRSDRFSTQQNLISVVSDDAFGVRQAVRSLWDYGHRSIAYLGGPKASHSNAARSLAFDLAIRELAGEDAEVQKIERQSNDHTASFVMGANGFERLLSRYDGVTAVVCYSDIIAIGAIRAASIRFPEAESVPNRVSICGFDGLDIASYLVPKLATVYVPRSEQADRAIAAIHQWVIDGAFDRPAIEPPVEVMLLNFDSTDKTVGPPVAPRDWAQQQSLFRNVQRSADRLG